jgi:cell division transport system permease protein
MFNMGTTRRAQRGMFREWRLHTLSVFSLAVAFVCLGSALLVVTNLKAIEERWAHAGRVSIYLKETVATPDVESLKAALSATPGVKQVRYLSSATARQEFLATEGKAIAGMPQESFPASIEVDVTPEMGDSDIASVVAKLEKLPGVEEIETYQAWTERLGRLLKGGVAAAFVLAFVVFASVLAVVGSTIRLALQRRRTEVEVLKLVGATDRFIKGPFLVEGSAQGAMGAVGALGLLGVLFFIVRTRLDGDLALLIGVEPTFLPWYLALGMVAMGGVLGGAAALLGLRRLVAV